MPHVIDILHHKHPPKHNTKIYTHTHLRIARIQLQRKLRVGDRRLVVLGDQITDRARRVIIGVLL